ncbi:hypothetical protein ACHAW5_007671 [Stephanodiscus triporus]|uniref:Uncharacterized protein n=1 Tax=Stephanodiscus triporus TaxID=2934178 RepID=A0ABD3PMQ2_9STRA
MASFGVIGIECGCKGLVHLGVARHQRGPWVGRGRRRRLDGRRASPP